MAAVGTSTSNGFAPIDPPTPEEAAPQLNDDDSEDGDLFGDDDEEPNTNQRTLDDEELDSGDDENREDRLADPIEDGFIEEQQHREHFVQNVDVSRIRQPEGDELFLMNLPPFIGLNSRNFDYPTYEPPSAPHDAESMKSNEKFSSYSTAASTIYWRRDPNPKNKDTLQSNARFIRWSDGSLTLQLASKPSQQYNVSTSAFRQNYDIKKNRLKSTPVPYDPNRDTHNYLAAPHSCVGMDMQIARPLDAALRIQKSGDLASESINRLKAELARAVDIGNPLDSINRTKEDPDTARRKAEKAEKDLLAAERKAVNEQYRTAAKRDHTLGRSGARSGVGLSIGGLEDDEGMPSARGTRRTGAAKGARGGKRKTNRHGEIYSDDEDETLPRGRTREDEYDRNDDFLADSEEEPETYEDEELAEEDDEDAEGEVDEDVGEIPERRPPPAAAPVERRERERAGTPKGPAEDDDDDAGGPAAGRGSPSQMRKKRRVIDDDDEDE